MASSSKEQELAIKIAGKVENSFKQSLGVTEDGLNKIASVAKKAAAVAAAAFAAVKVGDFISGAVDEYAEFEQAMANTSAIAGASADDYAKLSAAAREAGKATTFTASEAADALGYMALAGWNVEESTAALTPVLKLAEATQADLATTSDQVTDSMSAMGVGIDDLQGYLDVIVTTNNKANTTAADLMDAFIGCGGAARAAGMNYKETSTALGILANNGIKGSEAGTALNSMLVRISTKDVAQKAFNALYAKDAIVKAASTAATWAQTAATTAWNVVCTAATAVTTALGAAFTFLTSPIGLVILAIGAVIAIGVLLYKNWDTVKEKAGQLGEWISAKFSALKDAVCNAVDGFKDKFPVAFEFIKTTLENIGQEVAKRAGIKLYYEAPRIPIEKVEQSEKDDCSFYNELVKLYGFAMKIYKNKIVVFNEATYEKKKSVATLTEQNIEPNWSWNTKLCRTYTGAKYEYTNNDKNQTIKVEVGGGNRILKVTDAASNASEAERITLAKINEANKGDTTMSVTMTRANRKIIATSCVTIKGFGKLDGKYYVEKVTWDIGSGCKQKLDLRRVADRFTDAKSSTKAVAKKSKTETKSSTATTTATKSTGTQTPVKGGKYTLTTTKKGYYTAAEALAGKVTGGHPTGTRRPGTYTIFNISQGMLNLTTKAGVPGSWINPN